MRGARIETLIGWHRQGRTSDERALALVHRPVRYWIQRILVGWMPAKWHRAFTEPRWAWSRLREKISFVYHFLRTPAYREAWLLEQVRLGGEEGMLTEEEAEKISRQIKGPVHSEVSEEPGSPHLHAPGHASRFVWRWLSTSR